MASFFHLACFQYSSCCSIYQYFISFYCWTISHYMDSWHFVYPFITWWTFFFTLWLLWTFMYKFLCGHIFSFPFVIYLDMELLGHTVTMFNCLRSCQTIFQSDSTILHSHQQYTRVLISSHPQQHLLLSDFFDSSHHSRCEVVSHGFDLHFTNN